jgi:SAM-dependent methyltransferase
MRIFVAIASYGNRNDKYLERVLQEYRSLQHQTDIVVLSNVQKNPRLGVDVVVGLPSKNPHSLPFRHKKVFADRKDAYDLFIYTEDDILITQRNIDAFVRASDILPQQNLAGFFRWEQFPDGTKFYPDVHAFYRWLPDSVKMAGGYVFARFTNDHSGCFALTRSQLARAIESGGFLVPPHEGRLSLLETAATDPYTQCGFTKVICLSHFDDFLVHHLPDKYAGSALGLGAPDFSSQIERLLDRRYGRGDASSLVEPETKIFRCRWSKNYYEPSRTDLIGIFRSNVRTALSIGCGWGETERELVKAGVKVTAVPLDSIVAACAEARSVEIVYGDLDSAIEQLRGKQFDGVLMSGILHLLPDPERALVQAGSLLGEGGLLVATIPAFGRLPVWWLRLRHPSRYQGWRDFQRSGIHPISLRLAKTLFRRASLSVNRVSRTIPKRWRTVAALTGGVANRVFCSEYTIVGARVAAARRMAEINPFRTQDKEIEII